MEIFLSGQFLFCAYVAIISWIACGWVSLQEVWTDYVLHMHISRKIGWLHNNFHLVHQKTFNSLLRKLFFASILLGPFTQFFASMYVQDKRHTLIDWIEVRRLGTLEIYIP